MSDRLKYNNLEDFLSSHVLDKSSDLPVTHTTFGTKYNAKYHIPLEKQNEFLNLYHRHIIKTGKTHNIIERQLIEKDQSPGPLLIDIDLRFAEEHVERQYTSEHIQDLLASTLECIENTFDMDEDIQFPIFVMEKPSPRVDAKPTGNIVKDGIHIIIGLSLNRVYHQYIRDQIVPKLETIWGDMPITNSKGWDDVIDSCISNGTNGWLMLNSKKKDDQSHYQLTHVFDISYDTDENKWNVNKNTEDIAQYISKNHKLLSARYNERPTLLLKTEMIPVIKQFQEVRSRPAQTIVQTKDSYQTQEINELGYRIPTQVIRSIKTADELNSIIETFLDAVDMDVRQRDLRNAYDYAMALPAMYYEDGSYDKWYRVCMVLRNTSLYLLPVFIAFSARSKTFSFSSIPDLCDKWTGLPVYKQGGLTKDSLMYWVKTDAYEAFKKIQENTLDYYIDATIESLTLDNLNKKKGGCKGSTDSDIAEVLYQMKQGEYVASTYKTNEWYRFRNNRWVRNDSGVELRKVISSGLRDVYRDKASDTWAKARAIPEDRAEERDMLKAKADKVLEIAMMLGKTKEKDNIMKEAREKFYDDEFVKKIDQDKYKLCFNNGVIDFKEQTFRPGNPEDYITKCTGIDYVKLDPSKHQQTMDEITQYMHNLFPEDELCEYMWDHLSSILIGDTALNQCLHYYTGIGQNGKSILVTLIQKMLGEYAVELDIKFFTQERTKMGGTSSELYNTIGARFAVAAEPKEGDKLNEGPMKQITSGTDKMSCRPLYGNLIEFVPQINCVIMANHFLDVKSTDWGTWRRIRPVPFKSLFTDNPVKDDPHQPYQFKKVASFEDKFETWAPIFMSMLIERAFKTKGIAKECAIVKAEREAYRHQEDKVAEYVSSKLIPTENGVVGKTELITAFNDWYKEIYQNKINKNKELLAYMDKHYIAMKNVKDTVTGWKGVSILYDTGGYTNSFRNVSDDETTISDSSVRNE